MNFSEGPDRRGAVSKSSRLGLPLGLLAQLSLVALPLAAVHGDEGKEFEGVRLTQDGALKRDPVFVHGGKEVMYGVDENRVQVRLQQLDLSTLESRPVHPDATRTQFGPALSPDGRYLAFTECTGNLKLKFVIRDLQQKQDAEIKCSGRGGTRGPAFSPDSKRVLYCFAEVGPQQIFSVDVNGAEKRQLTEGPGIHNWPSFTPDGQTIVFGSSRHGTYEIFSMRADGSDVRRLTTNTFMDIRPRLSPDGTRIAFVRQVDGNRDVYVMDIDGTNVHRVTRNEERDDYPDWHPDGQRLVIVSERDGRHDLFLVPALPTGVSS